MVYGTSYVTIELIGALSNLQFAQVISKNGLEIGSNISSTLKFACCL
jgi:hypothetical protein